MQSIHFGIQVVPDDRPSGVRCAAGACGRLRQGERITGFELFGWDRVVFASNFPVDGLDGSYADLLRVFDNVLEPDHADQLDKFFAANAEWIYRV